jgi:hypothetical protein
MCETAATLRPVGPEPGAPRPSSTRPAAAFPCPLPVFALTRDLPLPAPADPRRGGLETALGGLSSSAELGVIIGIVPPVTPAARDAAGREDGLAAGDVGRHR